VKLIEITGREGECIQKRKLSTLKLTARKKYQRNIER